MKSIKVFCYFVFSLLVLAGCARGDRSSFQLERPISLSYEENLIKEELILKMLDREALFTLIGGVKPMSTGFWQTRIDVENPDLSEVNQIRHALRSFELEFPIYAAGVMTFNNVHEGERYLDAFVVNRQAFRGMMSHFADFWEPYGLTSFSSPEEVVNIVERMPSLDRFRGYGYLFGYPLYAVDFFVEAADEGSNSSEFVERDFINIPVHETETGRFVYAVPKGATRQAEDDFLSLVSEEILEEYRSVWRPEIEQKKLLPSTALKRWLRNIPTSIPMGLYCGSDVSLVEN